LFLWVNKTTVKIKKRATYKQPLFYTHKYSDLGWAKTFTYLLFITSSNKTQLFADWLMIRNITSPPKKFDLSVVEYCVKNKIQKLFLKRSCYNNNFK